jgi:hypothetical protein
VFKSTSDNGSDYGYIQYEDDGGSDSGTQNGLLTIGVQNDAHDWGQGVTHSDQIKFDVAGASAYLEARANSTGGNLASLLSVGSGYFTGVYSDAFDISDAWNQGALDAYSSTSEQDRYALYQYFDNADDVNQDMALVGFNGGTDDAVDGAKPYGYMYRCSRTPNRFIAFQTLGLEGSNDSRGMKLGVSAYPGVSYEFAVGGKSHFGNDIDISGGNLDVTGTTTVGSTLGVTGATTLSSTLGVTGTTTLSSTLGVTGATTLSSTLGVTGDATMSSGLIVSGDASLSGVNASGAATMGSTLGVTGDATMSSGLIVSGDASLTDVNVSGAAVVGSTLGVTGATTLSSTLGVTGATTMSSTLGVTGATTLSSTLGVSDAATLSSSLAVTGATTLSSTLGVTGATTLSSTLGVSDATTLSSTLGVTGATTLSSTLGVTGDATFSGDVQTSSITTSSGNLVITPGGTGKVTIASDLTVDGSVNFTGDFIKTDTIVRITEQVDVSNDGTGPAMRVTQHGDQPVAEFYDDANLSMIIKNGGDVSLAGNLTVAGAGMFTGSTSINHTTAPSGVYLGNNGSVGYQDSIIQMTSDGDYSVIDFTRNGASGTDADHEGRIIFANGNHTTIPYQLSFSPRGANSAALTLKAVASGSIDADVDGMVTLTGGVRSDDRNYESSDYWNASLNCGNDYRTWGDYRNAAYLYVDHGYTSNADLLLTGHTSGAGGSISWGYNLYSKGAVQAGVTDQGLCIQTEYDGSSNFRLGLGARPYTYQFLTTGDVKVGGKLDVDGSLNVTSATTLSSTLAISESGSGTAASATGGSITLSHTETNGTGKNSIVFKSASNSDNYGYIEFVDDGAGSGIQNGILTIGIQDDTSILATINNSEMLQLTVAGTYATMRGWSDSTGAVKGSLFTTDATEVNGIDSRAYNLNTAWGTTLDYYDTVNSTERYAMYQYFNHTQSDIHDMALVGYNAGTGSGVNPDGNFSYGYMYRSKNAPNKFISFQTRGLRYTDNDEVDGMRLGVNAVPGYTYDFAVGGKSHLGNTLTITESGTGTAAGHSSGSILLKRSSTNGRSSIVFDSVNSGDDFAYIEFQDEGGPGSGSANGQLTIGVQNDTSDSNKERILFDIAGANAYLEVKANSAGGNLGSNFNTNYVTCTGLYADAAPLDTLWDISLTAYDSTNDQNRSALYQYFDNAHDSNNDMAFTGMNAAGGSTVDGSSKPYGYMLHTKSDGYIAYQTGWIDGVASGSGLALGVNALPGRYYDFAVGGKSHFGNDVDMCGNLTVGGAGIFTGESSNYNNTTSPVGIYIGKYVSAANEYANMQFVSNNNDKKSWIDFVNNGTSETDYEGRIAYHGAGGSPSKAFVIHPYGTSGGSLTMQSLGSSAAEATMDGLLTIKNGLHTDIRNYETYWAVDGSNAYLGMNQYPYGNHQSNAYFHIDGADGHDLLLTGHRDSTGGITTRGFNLYSKLATLPSQSASYDSQGLCFQLGRGTTAGTTYDFALGIGARPNTYQFLTTKNAKIGGNLDVDGTVTESSDERLKTDIEPIRDALDKISRLRGVSYRLKKDYDASSIKRIGMIAQEMQSEFPELVDTIDVDTDKDGVPEKYYGIKYSSFTASLVEAIKELKTKNDTLEAENTLLKSQMQDVLARLTALENK